MTLSNILNKAKLFVLFIVLITITGCNANTNNFSINGADVNHLEDNAELHSFAEDTVSADFTADTVSNTPSKDYTISFKNYWRDELSFNVIQLRDMDDFTVSEIANENIKDAMTAWISGKVINASSINLNILCHSDKYLSFVNEFEYNARRVDYIKDYITIDVKSGKRVMLNDLVEINEKFAKHVQKNEIAKASVNSDQFDSIAENLAKYLKQMESADLLKEFEKCSLTQEQVIKDGYFTIEESIEALVFRNSFYLQTNHLVIVLQHGGELHVTLCLDDIVDFLKVEKW